MNSIEMKSVLHTSSFINLGLVFLLEKKKNLGFGMNSIEMKSISHTSSFINLSLV